MERKRFCMDIQSQIKEYRPFNEQEERDKTLILEALDSRKDLFNRDDSICHMTASAWVVNPARDKVLMVYHNIYHSWSWLGGHADGQKDLVSVAIREVKEESGLNDIKALSKDIFSLEVLTVDGHIKRGKYVSSHLHLNLTYLLEADDHDPLFVKPDENSGVRWFSLKEAVEASNEEFFKERIYPKLNTKLALFLAAQP